MSIKSIVSVGILAFVLISLLFYYNYRPQSISANVTSSNGETCEQSDTFLCASLALLSEEDFINKVFGATVESYDGATVSTQTWIEDANKNYSVVTVIDGKETDRVIHQNNKHLTRNYIDNIWHERDFVPEQNPANYHPLADQLGLDETLGAFLVGSPILRNFNFVRGGTVDCDGAACIQYEAIDTTVTTPQKRRILYFDATTNRLFKYQTIDPSNQTTHSFDYSPQLTVDTVSN